MLSVPRDSLWVCLPDSVCRGGEPMSLGMMEVIVGIVALLVLAGWFPWGALLGRRYTRMGVADLDDDHDNNESDFWSARRRA